MFADCMGGKISENEEQVPVATLPFPLYRETSWTDSASSSASSVDACDRKCVDECIISTTDTAPQLQLQDGIGHVPPFNGNGASNGYLDCQNISTATPSAATAAAAPDAFLSGPVGSQCSLCGYTLENGQGVLMAPSCVEGLKV